MIEQPNIRKISVGTPLENKKCSFIQKILDIINKNNEGNVVISELNVALAKLRPPETSKNEKLYIRKIYTILSNLNKRFTLANLQFSVDKKNYDDFLNLILNTFAFETLEINGLNHKNDETNKKIKKIKNSSQTISIKVYNFIRELKWDFTPKQRKELLMGYVDYFTTHINDAYIEEICQWFSSIKKSEKNFVDKAEFIFPYIFETRNISIILKRIEETYRYILIKNNIDFVDYSNTLIDLMTFFINFKKEKLRNPFFICTENLVTVNKIKNDLMKETENKINLKDVEKLELLTRLRQLEEKTEEIEKNISSGSSFLSLVPSPKKVFKITEVSVKFNL